MTPGQLRELFTRHSAQLVLYARQLCNCSDDVVQEAFLKLSQQSPPPDNPLYWLMRVVRNGAIGEARKGSVRRHHEESASRQAGEWFMESADARIDAQAAARAIQQLPNESREIVVAYFWTGLTLQEIAGLTGMSDSTVHRRLQESLALLRERLGTP